MSPEGHLSQASRRWIAASSAFAIVVRAYRAMPEYAMREVSDIIVIRDGRRGYFGGLVSSSISATAAVPMMPIHFKITKSMPLETSAIMITSTTVVTSFRPGSNGKTPVSDCPGSSQRRFAVARELGCLR